MLLSFLGISGAAQEKPSLFGIFRENYCVTGIPLNARPDWDTNDIAFQMSVKMNLLSDISGSGLCW